MDIQHLVDRLEDLIDEGRHMPFSKFTMIDEERALELIDQMRISIPEEIEKAHHFFRTVISTTRNLLSLTVVSPTSCHSPLSLSVIA